MEQYSSTWQKFYDNVDVHKLTQLAKKHNYPLKLLVLRLQMHMGVRGLKCFNMHPGHRTPSNGIVAGCTQSTTFAKILLMDAMIEAHRSWITHNTVYNQIRTFVDDIRVTTRGTSRAVKNKFNKAVPKFVTQLKSIGCKIGEKTTCFGTLQVMRKHLAALLRRQKVKSQTSQATKDLGTGSCRPHFASRFFV